MNALIYAGLSVYYYNISSDSRKSEKNNRHGDGIVDIVMIVFSAALFVFLMVRHREECLKS